MSRVPTGALTTVSGDRFVLIAEVVAERISDFVESDGCALEAGGRALRPSSRSAHRDRCGNAAFQRRRASAVSLQARK